LEKTAKLNNLGAQNCNKPILQNYNGKPRVKNYDEDFRLKNKAIKICNYWSKKQLALPNIFKMIYEITEGDIKYNIEAFDLSKKELLLNANPFSSEIPGLDKELLERLSRKGTEDDIDLKSEMHSCHNFSTTKLANKLNDTRPKLRIEDMRTNNILQKDVILNKIYKEDDLTPYQNTSVQSINLNTDFDKTEKMEEESSLNIKEDIIDKSKLEISQN